MRLYVPTEPVAKPGPLPARAFSLVEIMVVVALLSLIVLALMAVFNSTQRAFRASVTQTDVLETGRSAVDLIATDLRSLTPSYGSSNYSATLNNFDSPVNFYTVANNNFYLPLIQALPGSSVMRTNKLNYFFILGRVNNRWIATGYVVDNTNSTTLYPLYRYYRDDLNVRNDPWILYNNFNDLVRNSRWDSPYMSRLASGVVHLNVRAFDQRGRWIQQLQFPFYTNALNTYYPNSYYAYAPNAAGEQELFMLSNTIPASIELEVGVLEDRTLARAESLGIAGQIPIYNTRQSNFLGGASGNVHLFRQRLTIPNFDSTAYIP